MPRRCWSCCTTRTAATWISCPPRAPPSQVRHVQTPRCTMNGIHQGPPVSSASEPDTPRCTRYFVRGQRAAAAVAVYRRAVAAAVTNCPLSQAVRAGAGDRTAAAGWHQGSSAHGRQRCRGSRGHRPAAPEEQHGRRDCGGGLDNPHAGWNHRRGAQQSGRVMPLIQTLERGSILAHCRLLECD